MSYLTHEELLACVKLPILVEKAVRLGGLRTWGSFMNSSATYYRIGTVVAPTTSRECGIQ